MTDDLVATGLRLVEAAHARGVPLRLLGGVAIAARGGVALPAALRRPYGDIDLYAPRQAARGAAAVLREAGLAPDEEFNAFNGGERQKWLLDPGREDPHVDLFVGRFRMCHELELDARVGVESPSLPAADLLMTKLQIVRLNAKDVTDVAALLATHEPAEEDGPERLSVRRLVDLTRGDWGLYTTATDNLERLPEHTAHLDGAVRGRVLDRAGRLGLALAGAPKTRAWKLRARVGRAKRWYAEPEEAG